MKKMLFVFMFLNYILLNVFSDEDYNIRTSGYYHNEKIAIRFTGQGEIIMYDFQDYYRLWITDLVRIIERFPKIKEGRYTIVSEHGIPFININWNNNRTDKYLFLFYGNNDRILLYDNESSPFFNGKYWEDSRGYDGAGVRVYGGTRFMEVDDISATSSLREGNTLYSPDIGNLTIGRPWAAARNGIGEKITFRATQMVEFYISTGFVSYNRPYLYEYNSRPSRIRVSYNNFFAVVNLDDTPHFQKISIYEMERDGNAYRDDNVVEIEILGVHHGIRFSDVCITSILYYFSQ
jgi:hypothetical protein